MSGTDDAAGGVLSARSNSSTKNATNTLIPGHVHNTFYFYLTEIIIIIIIIIITKINIIYYPQSRSFLSRPLVRGSLVTHAV